MKKSIVQNLHSKGLIKPPQFVVGGVQYETYMGSVAYGVSNLDSDIDIYGFCIPSKEYVYPHLHGYLQGFDKDLPRFDQYQQHHIKDGDKEYDVQIYNIVKYFALCRDNNPNMIDSLFTRHQNVVHMTNIAQMVRANRKLFLHKGALYKFKGYAYSQLHKAKSKNRTSPKRVANVEKYGYDVKFAYHLVRLLNEANQIWMHGDIDLMENREQLKAIRRGEWTLHQLEEYFERKETELEEGFAKSNAIPNKPNNKAIKELLFNCLEEYYGSVDVIKPNQAEDTLQKIRELLF